jgi:hypothetical protein
MSPNRPMTAWPASLSGRSVSQRFLPRLTSSAAAPAASAMSARRSPTPLVTDPRPRPGCGHLELEGAARDDVDTNAKEILKILEQADVIKKRSARNRWENCGLSGSAAHGRHRAGRAVHAVLAGPAEQGAGEFAGPAAADHEQIGARRGVRQPWSALGRVHADPASQLDHRPATPGGGTSGPAREGPHACRAAGLCPGRPQAPPRAGGGDFCAGSWSARVLPCAMAILSLPALLQVRGLTMSAEMAPAIGLEPITCRLTEGLS